MNAAAGAPGADPGNPAPGAERGETHRRALVLVISTRAAAGVYADRTGPVLADWLQQRGWLTPEPVLLPDGPEVAAALRHAVAAGVDLVLTTGGTGVSPTDRTPEATAAVLDRELPGIAEEIRRRGAASTPTALLSRGMAGVAGNSIVVNLPGSPGGVRDGLSVLDSLLDHLWQQLTGVPHGQ